MLSKERTLRYESSQHVPAPRRPADFASVNQRQSPLHFSKEPLRIQDFLGFFRNLAKEVARRRLITESILFGDESAPLWIAAAGEVFGGSMPRMNGVGMFAPLPSSGIRIEEKNLPQPIWIVQGGDDTPIMRAGRRGRHDQVIPFVEMIDPVAIVPLDPLIGLDIFLFLYGCKYLAALSSGPDDLAFP